MKTVILAVLTIASMVMALSCTRVTETQTTAAPAISANTADTQQLIAGFEKEWVAAILAKDTAAIDRLLADDFIGTTNSQKYSKEEAVADVKTGGHESLQLDNIDVRVYGDTAIATMDQEEKSRHDSEDFSGHYLFTNVWVKLDGKWRAVASHGSRIR